VADLFFTFDLSFNLWFDFALLLGVFALESIAGNEEGSGAEWAVLWALHIGLFLSIEISADTAGLVS